MIKLKYRKIEIEGYDIFYAKYRRNRNLRLSISADNVIRVTCPYLVPEFEIERFVRSKLPWIKEVLEKNNAKAERQKFRPLTRLEKKELLKKIMVYINKYELLMDTEVSHVTIREMKTLWGSCTFKTHRIHFSTKLYFMSDRYIEYVVVHEMAHIFIPNHSKAFYDIVRRYIPDYKQVRKEGK